MRWPKRHGAAPAPEPEREPQVAYLTVLGPDGEVQVPCTVHRTGTRTWEARCTRDLEPGEEVKGTYVDVIPARASVSFGVRWREP